MDFSICLVFLASADCHAENASKMDLLEEELRAALVPICKAFGCSYSCDPFLSHSDEVAEAYGLSQQGFRFRVDRKVKSLHNYHYFASLFHAAAMLVGQTRLVSHVSVRFE